MMKSIQLLAITKSTVLQKYCPDIILESVMKEMRKLESMVAQKGNPLTGPVTVPLTVPLAFPFVYADVPDRIADVLGSVLTRI